MGLVVFIYVPSHAGVVPNAYADGVAKACLKRTTRTRTGPMIARLIHSRSVIYEKREKGQSQLKDGPTFRHVKKGVMEWVRRRAKSQYREGMKGYWNQKVLGTIGRGPPLPKTEGEEHKGHITPDEAKAYAVYATQRMRITCGCRTGMIAGGPQGEKRMERAAEAKGSAAEYIIMGGCRGCMAKGKWPGDKETTEHCLLDCACRNVRDLIQWKEAVIKKLKYMIVYMSKIGQDACTIKRQLKLALGSLTNNADNRRKAE